MITSESSKEELNLSLEEHLIDTLRPLPPLLPNDLAEQLAPYLSTPPPPLIPYRLLFSVSQWARSEAGADALHAQNPPLNPQSYSMVSLLAGITTSPERRFGKYTPPKNPAEVETEKHRERRAITALLNALLSIVGVAVAAYWAAAQTGWRIEWRVLLSLFVATAVAISEGALFFIWQSRRVRSSAAAQKKGKLRAAKHKKDDSGKESTALPEPGGVVSISSTDFNNSELRQRK